MDNLVQDTANIVGLAKSHSGSDDVLVYGPEMLGHISEMPDGQDGKSVRKLLAVSGLNNELHGERVRIQDQLANTKDLKEKLALTDRLKKIDKLIGQAEIQYRDITSNASDVMNAARANRIYRDTYFAEEFASKILSEQQRKDKAEAEGALDKTDITDKDAESVVNRPSAEAEKEVGAIIDEKNKSTAGKEVESDITGKKEKDNKSKKEKAKNVVTKLKERIRKKPEGETREKVLDKESAEKKANDYLRGSTLADLFKKAKEQTKKPC